MTDQTHPFLELDILITAKDMTDDKKTRFVAQFKALVAGFGWDYSGSFTPLTEEQI